MDARARAKADLAERGDSRRPRGTNQSGMRDANERLTLSLVRRHGALAKSEIAGMTGLSAQTVSVIMRKLEADALLLRREPVRGRVGQPSVPMALNPDGALFFGLKVGRRSADLVLIDFLGAPRAMVSLPYRYPDLDEVLRFVSEGVAKLTDDLPAEARARIAGLGIAVPFDLWKWADAVGAPDGAMDRWRHVDLAAEIADVVSLPIYLQNDATAACGAELVLGTHEGHSDFLYFYLGAFIGGGVVMDGAIYSGITGNAGALGSMPVPSRTGRIVQLIDIASITLLENALQRQGRDAEHLWTSPNDWGDLTGIIEDWIEGAAEGLAYAILAATSVIDFRAAIVDGWMPIAVRGQLVARTGEKLTALAAAGVSEGLDLPVIHAGTIGLHARAMGAATLPLADRFLPGPLGPVRASGKGARAWG